MSRKRRRDAPKKKKQGGVMMGLRGGFKGTVNAVTGQGTDAKKKSTLLGNVVTIVLFLIAGALFLRRCGYVKF